MIKIYTHSAPHHVDEMASLGLISLIFDQMSVKYQFEFVDRTFTGNGVYLDYSPIEYKPELEGCPVSAVFQGVAVFDHHVHKQESCTFEILSNWLIQKELIHSKCLAKYLIKYAQEVNQIDHGVKYDSDLIFKPMINIIDPIVVVGFFKSYFQGVLKDIDTAAKILNQIPITKTFKEKTWDIFITEEFVPNREIIDLVIETLGLCKFNNVMVVSKERHYTNPFMDDNVWVQLNRSHELEMPKLNKKIFFDGKFFFKYTVDHADFKDLELVE